MRNIKVLSLVLLPLLLIITGFYLKSEIGFFHLFSTDPVYAYIFDGLNICNLTFPFLVQGPGTPLSLLSALVIEIVHLIRQQDTLIADVLRNPDIYLSAINSILTILQGFFLFLMGFWVFKSTKNIFVSAFLQLTPFVSWIFIDLMRPIMVENLILIGVLCLIALVITFISEENNLKRKVIDKYIILFSIIIGFVAATKLMYLPIAIIPFLLIQGFKKKGIYILFLIIAFALFAFPIFNSWVTFRTYYVDNFMHSGVYGTGPKTIVDIHTFIANLYNIYSSSRFYIISLILITVGIIVYWFPILKIKQKEDKEYRTLIGIFITMLVMTLLVAKQYKFYYLTTALLLVIPGYYFLYTIYTRNLSTKSKVIIIIPCIILIALNCYSEVNMRLSWHSGNLQKKENYLQMMNFIEKRYDKNQPTLLIPDYYGAPYKAYGCFYGMAWCRGNMREVYAAELLKLYPNFYIYHGWNNLFNQWNNSFSFINLMRKYNHVVLFSGDSNLENSLDSKLHGLNRQMDVKFEKIIFFSETYSTIYEVTYDSIKGLKPFTIKFDAELLDSSNIYYLNNEGYKAGNGITRSSDYARIGKYSCKLTKVTPYGLTCVLSEVQKEEHYLISVWRYNNSNKNTGLVVSANDLYYKFQTGINKTENNWQKITIDFVVPENLNNQDVKIYVLNNDNNLPAYFDDLTIERK
jgi:hypothetical protein